MLEENRLGHSGQLNLGITKVCNKHCSFCFMDDKTPDTEMSLEFINQVLDQLQPSFVNILGGEPTTHSQFKEVIKLVTRKRVPYGLISNLLFSEDILTFLRTYGKGMKGVLGNAMELDKGNRVEIFDRNLYGLGMIVDSVSLTITKDTKIEEMIEYCQFLKANIRWIPNTIRIGLDLSGTYIINNKLLGDIIGAIQMEFGDKGINLDCQVPYCVWNFDPTTHLTLRKATPTCVATPIDVFHDGSAYFCYPARRLRIENVLEFNHVNDLADEFRRLYREEEKRVTIPEECKQCPNYLWGDCRSLCMGCLRAE